MAKLLITGDVSTRFMVKNNISSMSLKRSGIQLVKKNIDHWLQCIIKVIQHDRHLTLEGAQAAILVYDVTKKKTLENLRYWIDELKNNGPKDIRTIDQIFKRLFRVVYCRKQD